jgi:predicted nucleotidyltransferase
MNDLNDNKDFEELKELVNSDKLDATTSMNILINAVQASYDKDHFNDLDRYLILKSLNCFKELVELGEDFYIKVKY